MQNAILKSIFVTFIIILKISNCAIPHAFGPTYRQMALKCMDQIKRIQFYPKVTSFRGNNRLPVMILVSKKMESPAYEIQDLVVKNYIQDSNFPVEIIRNKRINFKSFRFCINCPAERYFKIYHSSFVPHYRPSIVIIVVDNLETFDRKLKVLIGLHNFNSRALHLIFFASDIYSYRKMATKILLLLKREMIFKAAVLITRNLKVLEVFTLNSFAVGPDYCGSHKKLQLKDRCDNGNNQ